MASRRIRVYFSGQGREVMPPELWEIVDLLAERRGQTPEAVLEAMVRALVAQADAEGIKENLAAQEAADVRYCQAEGIQDVRDYAKRAHALRLGAALSECLEQLRDEPWRTSLAGLDM